MKTPEHWIDETPGVIHDEEHRNDLLELYAKIQYDAASELSALQKENAELKKWKEEDPRMLREQIRVADVAFNALQERHNSLRTQNREFRGALELAQKRYRLIYAKNVDEIKTLPTPYDKALALQPEK